MPKLVGEEVEMMKADCGVVKGSLSCGGKAARNAFWSVLYVAEGKQMAWGMLSEEWKGRVVEA